LSGAAPACDACCMMNASSQDLGERIERLVQEHIEASRRAAQQAVERAFCRAGNEPTRRRRPPARVKSPSGKRRTPDEMAALGERLYQAVCAKPGERMTVLMADVGASARELSRPVSHLKRAGRIRSVGSRHLTRYFPMVSEATASA
jgi:hypothetical protein